MKEFPADWEVTKLSNKSKVKRGASPRPIKNPLWWGGNVGWVRISDVTSATKYLNKTTEYLSDAGVNQSIQIPRGEVILTICATIGVPIIVNTAACIHDGFVWFDGLGSDIDREYFYYFLLSKRESLAASRQLGTQGNLNTTIVGELIFPVPPLPEQQKIAEILSTLDEKLAVMDEQLAQTHELKNGLMQRLLTRGIGHTAFKDSPLGEIPESWEVVKLKSVSDFITKGSTPTTYGFGWVDSGVTFLRSECVGANGFTLSGAMFISEEAHNVMSRSIIKSGDLLMTITGNVGRICMLPSFIEEANINQHIARIRVASEAVLSVFVYQYLGQDSIIKEHSKIVTGQAYPQLSLKQVRDMQIPIPPLPEQHQIAEILTTIDDKLQVLTDKKAQYQELKRGLMQQLLTGQRRVRVAAEVAELA